MARFVQLPSGTVFAQKPLQFGTPLQGSNLTTKDVIDILNVAETVGKSESIGALAAKTKENLGAAYEGVKGLFGGDGKKTEEAAATQPTSEEIRQPEGMERKERRDLEGGSIFNKAAETPKPAVAPTAAAPINTEGTGAVLPPPKTEDKKDVTAPQAPPVKPVIPPPPSVVVAPTSAGSAPVKQQADDDLYIQKAKDIVSPPAPSETGGVTPQEQLRYQQEVIAKAQELKKADEAEKAKQAADVQAMMSIGNIPQRTQADIDAERKASAARVDEQYKLEQAAKARVQAQQQAAADKLAADEAEAVRRREAARAKPAPVHKIGGEAQPSVKIIPQRADINIGPVPKYEAPLKALEGVPLPKEGTPTSQADVLDKFFAGGTDALTDAEKFALAGGPAQAKAPQPSASPKAKKVVGAGGVQTQELKQKALEGRRPETTVPPAGSTAGAGAGVPAGRSAKETVVRAPSAAVPQVEAAQPGIAQPGFDIDAKTLSEASAGAGAAAGEKAAEQVARTQAQPAADFNQQYDKILGKIEAAPKSAAPAGTKDITERALLAKGDPETILKMVEAKIKADEEATAVKIPDKVSYQQLLALARKATRPADQAAVLDAFQRATNKPPPKTLVEMYNGDNETRAIAMLEAAFPAKAAADDAFTKQQKYAAAYKSVADAIKGIQAAEESQAREAGQTQKAYREESEIAAGDVTAEVANKLARARLYVEQAGDSAEKARRTRELVELEKAGIAATVAAKVAQADKAMLLKLKLAQVGGGAGGKKAGKINPNLEWGIKNGSLKDSIDEQRKIVANIQNQITRRSNIEKALPVLRQQRQQAVNAGPAFQQNMAAYDVRISEMEGELASLPTAQELRSQLVLEQQALAGLGQRQADLADEMLGRIPAVAPAKTSVPLVQGERAEGAGPQTQGNTGKAATKPGKGR